MNSKFRQLFQYFIHFIPHLIWRGKFVKSRKFLKREMLTYKTTFQYFHFVKCYAAFKMVRVANLELVFTD